ncbi:MAG: hypothetical protein MMC33_002816 [Icmadophila ericetorum]|nr:hypothetical protein [Icmadophila ericetorum]
MEQKITSQKQQELQLQYTTYKNNLQQLAQKIGEVESERDEHTLVLETLDPLPQDRKCFRMVNGVLVERTVKEVVPTLKTNQEGLKKVLDELVKQYTKQQEEMEKWKVWLHAHSPSLNSATWTHYPDSDNLDYIQDR